MGFRVTEDRRARRRGAGPERQVWRKEKEETVWRKKDRSERAARRGGRWGLTQLSREQAPRQAPMAAAARARGAAERRGPKDPVGLRSPRLAPP